MKMINVQLVGGLLFAAISFTVFAENTMVEIRLRGKVPPVSNDLSIFANAFADTRLPGEDVFIGFNGADIGMGQGTGNDEMVLFSFKYSPFKEIKSAILTLVLTPKNSLVNTDILMLADLGNLSVGFGRDRLQGLTVGQRQRITFDLLNIQKSSVDASLPPIGFVDFSDYLLDGDLDVIYLDDAIVHRVNLRINGVGQVPVPSLLVE